MHASAILVAAGRGERMDAGRPKAFLELAGRPLLLHAAEVFDAAPAVGSIVVVVPATETTTARNLLAGIRKLTAVVAGGERRQDSVRAGLQRIGEGFDRIVLVHDVARPLVDVSLIESVADAATASGAALPVLPLADTIKRIREGRVVETLDRRERAAAQTPQGFRFALLTAAYDAVYRDGVTVTDEAMAVERLGEPVSTVKGSVRNRKITTADDLAWAEGLLKGMLHP